MRILITGANRGIGLELTRQLLDRGETVFATCRHPGVAADLNALAASYPDRCVVLALEVTDDNQVSAVMDAIRAQTASLDLLISNAGILERGERFGGVTRDDLMTAFNVNSASHLMLAQAAYDLLRAGTNPVIVTVTSQLGSITNKRSGGGYSYAASKAALNMLTRALAHDVAPEITAIMMHPGWVQTDMGGDGAPLTPREAVAGMLRVIDGLSSAEGGTFYQWNGSTLPY